MAELQKGTLVTLTSGDKIKIINEISSSGGQGFIYLVEFKGKKYALKWYKQQMPESFYKNLQNNINQGSPSSTFLWPIMLTEKQYDNFGYVMNLKPNGYYDFSDFLLAKVRFSSINSMINAALKICKGFYDLHLRGFSYLDLNDGNFFINPHSGDVLICDNDNVVPQGGNSGIKGKMRFMAPEIVLGQNQPDKYSDYFSLSLVLFMLFFGNHPFEGKKNLGSPCMTEKDELKHYGKEILFIYDRNDNSNLPVRGVHTNVIQTWQLFPVNLRNAFIDAFSQDKLKNPSLRIMESQWGKFFAELRNQLVYCPYCGEETFYASENSHCTECRKPLHIQNYISTNNHGVIVISHKKLIYLGKATKPVGKIVINKQNNLLLQNLSNNTWLVETTSGKIRKVASNDYMPIKTGLKITFSQETKAKII